MVSRSASWLDWRPPPRGTSWPKKHLLRAAERLGETRPLAAWRDVVRGHLALATGDVPAARAWADAAAADASRSFEVRSALARLHAALPAAPPGDTLRLGPLGRSFVLGEGQSVDLSRRQALRLILKRLAEAHHERPDTALSVDEVFAAGWPDERIHPEAAQTRVYTAIAVLRRMGLRAVLVRRDDGYLLDPTVVIAPTR